MWLVIDGHVQMLSGFLLAMGGMGAVPVASPEISADLPILGCAGGEILA